MVGSGRSDSTYYDNVNMEMKGPHSHFEEVQLESNPAYETVLKPTSTNEPQYEECGGGVTNSGLLQWRRTLLISHWMHAACSTKLEGPTYQNVCTAAN